MLYKTIVLELIQDHPTLHERLKAQRLLLGTMNAYAAALKAKHDAWMDVLRPAWPDSDPHQIQSEAMELALAEITAALRHEFSMDEAEPFPIEEAMAYVRRHTPPD